MTGAELGPIVTSRVGRRVGFVEGPVGVITGLLVGLGVTGAVVGRITGFPVGKAVEGAMVGFKTGRGLGEPFRVLILVYPSRRQGTTSS